MGVGACSGGGRCNKSGEFQEWKCEERPVKRFGDLIAPYFMVPHISKFLRLDVSQFYLMKLFLIVIFGGKRQSILIR